MWHVMCPNHQSTRWGPFCIGLRQDHTDHTVASLQMWEFDWQSPWPTTKQPNARVASQGGRLVLTGTVLATKACLGSCRNILELDKVETVHGCAQTVQC